MNVVGPPLPSIPVATDLPSALQAINALRQTINIIINNTTPSNPGGSPGGGFKSQNQPNPQANFTEIRANRVTQTVRVFNPQDHNQFVDVQQITGLTFLDPQTKQTIVWSQ